MVAPTLQIVRTVEYPELVPVVASWLWEEFWRREHRTLEFVYDLVGASVAEVGPQQTFVLLADGKPVGTSSLVAQDLDERPDLTPWLAGVVIAQPWRGQGHVYHLIAAVEQACRDGGISELWLYTAGAQSVYARAGWQTMSIFDRRGEALALMCRRLR